MILLDMHLLPPPYAPFVQFHLRHSRELRSTIFTAHVNLASLCEVGEVMNYVIL